MVPGKRTVPKNQKTDHPVVRPPTPKFGGTGRYKTLHPPQDWGQGAISIHSLRASLYACQGRLQCGAKIWRIRMAYHNFRCLMPSCKVGQRGREFGKQGIGDRRSFFLMQRSHLKDTLAAVRLGVESSD